MVRTQERLFRRCTAHPRPRPVDPHVVGRSSLTVADRRTSQATLACLTAWLDPPFLLIFTGGAIVGDYFSPPIRNVSLPGRPLQGRFDRRDRRCLYFLTSRASKRMCARGKHIFSAAVRPACSMRSALSKPFALPVLHSGRALNRKLIAHPFPFVPSTFPHRVS